VTVLRLGHITYSNCFPVHARLIDQPRPGDPLLIPGVPSELNRLLDTGEIDVAPCSSIEYARHADRYRILPDLVIGADGPVRSILLLSDRDPESLDGELVGLPSASATSVVLLKILLKERWASAPRFFWFDQARDDPFAMGAAAALFIGDVAMRQGLHADRAVRLDLGFEWREHTGLPFAFAVWQAAGWDDEELGALHRLLVESRDFAAENRAVLAAKYALQFGMAPRALLDYWAGLTFHLDERMVRGLEAFYALAARIGEIPDAPEQRWVGEHPVSRNPRE
jgi:chorismate dehydratase